MTTTSSRQVALGTKGVSHMAVIRFIFIGDQSMLVAVSPVLASLSFFAFIVFLTFHSGNA
jgi:hypothetical protein